MYTETIMADISPDLWPVMTVMMPLSSNFVPTGMLLHDVSVSSYRELVFVFIHVS